MNMKLMLAAAFVVGVGIGGYSYFSSNSDTSPAMPDENYPMPAPVLDDEVVSQEPADVVPAEDIPDLTVCEALQEDSTYEGKYEDYARLLIGSDGWVFRSKQDLRQEFKFTEEDAEMYKAFSDALESRGTKIVLSVIPPRGMLGYEKLPKDDPEVQAYDVAAAQQSFRNMIQKLNTHGVLAIDASQVDIGSEYFNHADQHWTSAGARETARKVAELIKQPGVWKDSIPEIKYETHKGETLSYDGRFGEPIKELCNVRPLKERDVVMKTSPFAGDDNQDALFGEKPVPSVVLVGTSNSRRDEFDANFSGYLQEFLSADVLNAAISGGGMDDSLVAYLDSDGFKANAPAFLIWEIPGYYNLGGEGMENTLRQAIASVYGFCDMPLISFPPQKIEKGKERIYLMEGLQDNRLMIGTVYLAIDFDKPVTKDFSVSFKTSDRRNTLFKFKKRRESNGDTFYYMPGFVGDRMLQRDVLLADVALNVSKKIEGLTVKARLCAIPGMQ